MAYRTRLVLITAVSVAMISALSAVTLYFGVDHNIRSSLDNTLRDRASNVTGFFGYRPGMHTNHTTTDQSSPLNPMQGRPIYLPAPPTDQTSTAVQFLSSSGEVSEPVGGQLRISPTKQEIAVAAGQLSETYATHDLSGVKVRTYTARIGPNIAVQVSRPTSEDDATLARMREDLLLICLGGTLIALLLAAGLSSAMLTPLRRVMFGMHSVRRSGDLSVRLDEGQDEIGQIGRAFNEMLSDLQHASQQQRRFVSDASHELRTPITALRVNVELLRSLEDFPESEREHLIDDLIVQLDEVSELVNDMVELAREDEQEAQTEINYDELTDGIIERIQRQFPEVVISYDSEMSIIQAAPRATARAVSNIIHNAVRFGGGSPIEITLRNGVLAVRDHGPGIPEEDLQRVFERFYRSATSRGLPGTGLGLSMVAQAARISHGSARAENAPDGGAVVTLAFPPAEE